MCYFVFGVLFVHNVFSKLQDFKFVIMDPLPPSATVVDDSSSSPLTPDPVRKLIDLTSGCQISPTTQDPLQRAMDQSFNSSQGEDDFDDNTGDGSNNDDDGTEDFSNNGASVVSGDGTGPTSCDGDADDSKGGSNMESSGAADSGNGDDHASMDEDGSISSSQDSLPDIPGNQEANWRRFDPRYSQYHDDNPIAIEKAKKTASSLADSAQKIHDNFVGQGMVKHDFPEVSDESIEIDTPVDVSGPFRITIPELLLPSRSEFLRTFAVYGTTLDFVLTKRRSEGYPWYIPPLNDFADVINSVQVRIIEKRFKCLDVLVETKSWCGVGVISLKATCLLRLQKWREELTRLSFDGYDYNSFPKDALITKNTQVSILLRSGLRCFKTQLIAHELKVRNPLKGKMSIVYSKTYGPADKTRSGFSKNGWRLVIANVDSLFTESLKLLPFGYPFKIGASTAQIRLLASSGEPDLPPLGDDSAAGLQNDVPPAQRATSHDMMVQYVRDHQHFEQAQFRQQQVHEVAPQATPMSASREIPQEEVAASPLPNLEFPVVPELVRAITVPLSYEEVRPKTGPGSRGGIRAKNIAVAAASSVARKAYNAVMKLNNK